MEATPEEVVARCGPLPADCAGDPASTPRARVLLACFGWPVDTLESASWMQRQGLARTSLFRLNSHATSLEQFVRRIDQFDPHVVAFQFGSGEYDKIRTYMGPVRDVCNAEIVLLGPTATSRPIDVLEDSGADYAFSGEAERPLSQFLRLASQHNSKDRQPEIPGLAFRYGNRTYHNTLPTDGYGRNVLDAQRLVCCNTLRCLRVAARPVTEVELITANRLDWSLLEGVSGPFDGLLLSGGRERPESCTFCAKLTWNEPRNKGAAQLLDEIEAADAKVADGIIHLTRQDLFRQTDDEALQSTQVAWAAILDKDFLSDGARALEFFDRFSRSPLQLRYRLKIHADPESILTPDGDVCEELLDWIRRLKPMVLLAAGSFNPELLRRWRRRYGAKQLDVVIDALDETGQDYTVSLLLTDFESTPEELVETLRLSVLNALQRRRMRIVSTPLTIPRYDTDARRWLEYGARATAERARHFTDYERPQPGWMDPLVADLAMLADAQLQHAMGSGPHDDRRIRPLEALLERIGQERQTGRIRCLRDQAERALAQIEDAEGS